MADNEAKPAGQETGPTEKQHETVSREAFEAMKAELESTKQAAEAIKKAQAGSDSKVAQLLSELEQRNKGKQTAEERIAALERETQEAKAQAERERWINSGYKMATERGLPTTLVDRFSGSSDELVAFLDSMKARDEEIRLKVANEVMAGGHKPGPGGVPVVDPLKMSPEERKAYYIAETEKRLSHAT
jgi:predicted  nucleic acid-binding Zn-ribbon protein